MSEALINQARSGSYVCLYFNRFLIGYVVGFTYMSQSTVYAININCDFSDIENCIRNCYQCEVKDLVVTKPNQTATAINGFHLNPDDSNFDVVTLKIIDQMVSHLPSGLYQHFPYITVLRIWSSGLQTFTQKDVRELKYLTDLSLSGNLLEALDSDLFLFNRRLIKIDFSRNRLKHVGTNLLNPLKILMVADFYHNDCITDGGYFPFDDLIARLRVKCQPTNEMLIKEVQWLSNEIEMLTKEIEMRVKKTKSCEENNELAKLQTIFPSILAKETEWEAI